MKNNLKLLKIIIEIFEIYAKHKDYVTKKYLLSQIY